VSKNAEGDSEWICLAALGAEQRGSSVAVRGACSATAPRFVTAFRKGLNETGFGVYDGKIR
jgi:hypothetical protein